MLFLTQREEYKMICVFLDTNILHSKSTDFTKARFAEKLEELINDTQKMIELQNNARRLVKYDATKDIVGQIKSSLRK